LDLLNVLSARMALVHKRFIFSRAMDGLLMIQNALSRAPADLGRTFAVWLDPEVEAAARPVAGKLNRFNLRI